MWTWRTAGMVVCLGLGSSGDAWGVLEHNSGQGTQLIGQQDVVGVVWFPKGTWTDRDGRRFSEVYVEKGTLFARREAGGPAAPLEQGATVTARDTSGNKVRYRVRKVSPPPTEFATPDTSYYTLVNPDRADEPYCHPAPKVWVDDTARPSDADNGLQAVPVAEVWNRRGTQGRNREHFTMACMHGAIAKCYRWGYYGWNPKITRAHVQACTRMAMADYCGDGNSHTIDGTPIRMYDLVPSTGLHPIPAPVSEVGPGFETAWTGGDAEPRDLASWEDTHDERPSGGALCLTKKRWETIAMQPGPRCPRLADPRMSPPTQQLKDYTERDFFVTRFCDYARDGVVELTALVHNKALLVNSSGFVDDALLLWVKGNTGDHWSTTRLIDGGVQRPGVFKRMSDTFDEQGFTPPPRFLGSVFRPPTIPLSLQPALGSVPLRTLSTYRTSAGDSVTTTAPPPTVQPKAEGHVFPCDQPQPVGSIPLYHYIHGRGGPNEDHETTTTAPTAATTPELAPALPGCPAGLEGYLPRFPGL